jgi:hypothetical protein
MIFVHWSFSDYEPSQMASPELNCCSVIMLRIALDPGADAPFRCDGIA